MRKKIMHWLWRDDRGPWAQVLVDMAVSPATRICCAIWGHQPERDQCGIPDHDFCLWCLRRMPGAAG